MDTTNNIYSQDNIIKMIEYINNTFPIIYNNVLNTYMKENDIKIDENNPYESIPTATNYYSNGHCVSYANILREIYGKKAIMYNTDDHVFVKIEDNYYDVLGKMSIYDLEGALITNDESLNIIDIMYGQEDPCEKPVEQKLIELGKQKLEELKPQEVNGLKKNP